jgi:hypothetical protein
MSMSLGGGGDVQLRSLLVQDGLMLLDIGRSFSDAVEGLSVLAVEGGEPSNMHWVDGRTLLIEFPAGKTHEVIRVRLQTPDGKVIERDVRIDLRSGRLDILGKARQQGAFLDNVEQKVAEEEDTMRKLFIALAE